MKHLTLVLVFALIALAFGIIINTITTAISN